MPALIHLISAVTWGGGERYALDVCRHFRSLGWQVNAITRDSNAVDLPLDRAGIKVRHMPLRGYSDLVSPMRLASLLRRRPQGTVVHVHKYKDAFTALLARRIARRPDVRVVLTRHLIKPARRGWLSRCIYSGLDAQIFVSALARDRFINSWQGAPLPFPRSRIHTLHNSLLLEQPPYTPPPARGPRTVLFIGRLSPEKGVETLLQAAVKLRGHRTRIRICGTGQADYVDILKRLAQRLGIMEMIDWKGHVADVMPHILESHVAVLPSVAEEAFGLANIEVMSAGRLQICTASGAQREYLRDGRDAIFINAGDHEALADRLLSLLEDTSTPPRIITMGMEAHARYAEILAWPHFAARLESIYRSC